MFFSCRLVRTKLPADVGSPLQLSITYHLYHNGLICLIISLHHNTIIMTCITLNGMPILHIAITDLDFILPQLIGHTPLLNNTGHPTKTPDILLWKSRYLVCFFTEKFQ